MSAPPIGRGTREQNDKASRTAPTVPRRTDNVERRLRTWIDSLCDDPPLVDQLDVDDLSTDCGRASLLRAALVQLRSKQADVIEADLRRDLAADDLLVLARVRLASYDVSDACDWQAASRRPTWAELERRRAS